LCVFSSVDASIHVRDHSGKKARDVVKDTVAADVQSKFMVLFLVLLLRFFQVLSVFFFPV